MATSVLQIVIQTLKKGDGNEQTVLALKKVQSSWGDAMKVAGAATAIYFTLDRTIGASIRTFVDYAEQVRGIVEITGQSAESASRLIQVTDDYRISTEQLSKAEKALAKEGKTLTVETLAELSDQYRTLNTGAERQLFLTKEFGGRTGQAFAEMMTKGSAAIMARNQAIEQGLILSAQDIQAARDLQYAEDDLKDAKEALAVSIGGKLVPELNHAYLGFLTISKFLQMGGGNASLSEYAGIWDKATKAAYDQVNANHELNKTMQEQDDQLKEVTKANQAYLDLVSKVRDENQKYTQSLKDNATAQQDVVDEINVAIKQGYSPAGKKITELKGKLTDLGQAATDMAKAHDDATKRIVLDLITQKLAADGLSTDEVNQIIEIQKQWGFLDDATAAEATTINELTDQVNAGTLSVQALGDAIAGLDDRSISVDVFIKTHGSGVVGSTMTSGQLNDQLASQGYNVAPVGSAANPYGSTYAEGGQLGKGWALVGDAPGGLLTPYSELISPTGFVFNNEQTRALMAAGLNPKAFFVGGGIGYGDDPIGIPRTPADYAYNDVFYGRTGGTTTSGGGGGGGGGATRRRRKSTVAVNAAAAQAAVDAQAASQGLDEQAAQAAAIGAQGNVISRQILAAIDQLPERLAAKLAQGRL